MTSNRNFKIIFTLLLGFLAISFQSCLKDDCKATQTYLRYNPIYKQLDEIRTDIKIEGPRTLKNPGKLYFYGDFIFINEIKEGVHIIDNSNPETPQNLSFVVIPGNVDMAAKNGRMYVDNYIDLLTLDITDPKKPTVVTRTEDVFERYQLDQDLGYLIGFEAEEVTEEINCSHPNWGQNFFWMDDVLFANSDTRSFEGIQLTDANSNSGGFNVPAGAGTGGSLARFSIVENLLYTVDEWNLRIFDLTNCDNPSFENTVNIGWGVETIFPHQDRLFIGADHGMYIFDNTDPLNPTQESLFSHARACDPVFVVDDIAYVTLRDGTECEGFANQLDVVDVSNISNPQLLVSHPMENPHGLSVWDNTLYICEGDFGFKAFDASDHRAIADNQLGHLSDFQAYDVITLSDNRALIIGKDGFYQYDISDPSDMKEISKIPVIRD